MNLRIKKEKSLGFTLIEMIIVFSIAAAISTLGIASFLEYNRSSEVNSAASGLSSFLNLAKSRALSQVKPSTCTGILNGYKVMICKTSSNADCSGKTNVLNTCLPADSSDKDYAIYAFCDGALLSPSIDSKKLPPNVCVSNSSQTSFYFKVFTAGTEGSGNITIHNKNNNSKIINVSSDGRIIAN